MRRTVRTVLILALVAVLAACSGDDGDTASEPETEPTARPEPRDQRVEVELASTGAAWSRSVPREPIATAPSSFDGLDLELYLAERSGGAVTVVWALHNTTDEELGLDTSFYYIESTAPASERAMSGISLIDPEELRQYLVFRADDGTKSGVCVCSSSEGASRIEPDGRYFAMAVVAAPPASTETVTVATTMGAFPSVTLDDAGPDAGGGSDADEGDEG